MKAVNASRLNKLSTKADPVDLETIIEVDAQQTAWEIFKNTFDLKENSQNHLLF